MFQTKLKLMLLNIMMLCCYLPFVANAKIEPFETRAQVFELPWFAWSPHDASAGQIFSHGTGYSATLPDKKELYKLNKDLFDTDGDGFRLFWMKNYIGYNPGRAAGMYRYMNTETILIPTWVVTGVELRQRHSCVVYGPYRKHSMPLDIAAEIRMAITFTNHLPVNKDMLDDFLLITLDIFQDGVKYDSRQVRIKDLGKNSDDILKPDWRSFMLMAKDVPPSENGGYEVRVCQETIEPGATEDRPRCGHPGRTCKEACRVSHYTGDCAAFGDSISELIIGKIHITEYQPKNR